MGRAELSVWLQTVVAVESAVLLQVSGDVWGCLSTLGWGTMGKPELCPTASPCLFAWDSGSSPHSSPASRPVVVGVCSSIPGG